MSMGSGFLSGKTALVTGAGSGIGKAIAGALAGAGAHVIVNDKRGAGRAVAEGLGGSFIQADLSTPEGAERLAAEALASHGRVDVLVNNAGFQHVSPITEFPVAKWNEMLGLMLTAPFVLTKHLLGPMMEAGWGRIINVASIHALIASPHKAAYTAAKHGLAGLTKVAALEAGAHGVTVNAICPAYVRTPLVEAQLPAQAATLGIPEEEVVSRVMLEPAAIKRLIEPNEVGALALFLTSDAAATITGLSLPMYLCWTAR
jgi:3-hydroxybutyrate dehydrogenase